MIEFKGVWKSFKTTDAVKDVSFTIHDREVFGLLGPNGAVKAPLTYLLEQSEAAAPAPDAV